MKITACLPSTRWPPASGSCFPGAESAAALTDALAEEYDADRDTLDRDVAEFLDKLRSLGIL